MHANYPGSGWHTVAYRLGKRLCRDPRSVSVQRRHDRCVYTISHSKYICFCNFVILSFIWEKIQGDEVEVEKLLIVIFINRMRKNMSLAKRRFSEFNKKKCRFSEFSLNKTRSHYICQYFCDAVILFVKDLSRDPSKIDWSRMTEPRIELRRNR